MQSRLTVHLVAIALSASSICAQAPPRYKHSGLVVDAPSAKPLSNVTATAYSSNERKDNTLCPKYDGFADEVVTSKEGTFTLKILPANASYVVTYCNASYATFTRYANDNSANGTSIEPTPVRLFPRVPRSSDMFNAIRLLRDDSRRMAMTLRSKSGVTFEVMLQTLPDPERKLVDHWVDVGVTRNVGTVNVMALDRLTRNFRAVLEYYRSVSSVSFDSEVRHFDEISDYVSQARIGPQTSGRRSLIPGKARDYVIGMSLPLVPLGDPIVVGRTTRVEGRVTTSGLEPRGVTSDELHAAGYIVVPLVHDVRRQSWTSQPAIEPDADGFFVGEIDLGMPNQGDDRKLELVVVVTTPDLINQEIRDALDICYCLGTNIGAVVQLKADR
jgi:hypothetical protein